MHFYVVFLFLIFTKCRYKLRSANRSYHWDLFNSVLCETRYDGSIQQNKTDARPSINMFGFTDDMNNFVMRFCIFGLKRHKLFESKDEVLLLHIGGGCFIFGLQAK